MAQALGVDLVAVRVQGDMGGRFWLNWSVECARVAEVVLSCPQEVVGRLLHLKARARVGGRWRAEGRGALAYKRVTGRGGQLEAWSTLGLHT